MTRAVGYALFQTAIGACAVVWSETAIVGVRWPQASEASARQALVRRHPDAVEAEPPAFVQEAIDRVARLLAGEKPDLTATPLDFGDPSPLHLRIYERVRAIPPGQTMTYGEVARALGEPPQVAQEVGKAMGANPCPIIMPCHRVLAAGGKLGGFSAPGGAATKRRLLEIEGALPGDDLPLFAG